MDDTAPEIRARQMAIHLSFSGAQRLAAAAGMYDAVKRAILSTLPPGLPEAERNYRLFIRMHGEASEPLARKAFLVPRKK